MPFWHGLALRAELTGALRGAFGFSFQDAQRSGIGIGMGDAGSGGLDAFGGRRLGDGGRFVEQGSFSNAGTGFARGDELAGKFDDACGQEAGGLDDGFFEGIQQGLRGRLRVVTKALGAGLGGRGARSRQRIGADRVADEVRLIRGGFGFRGCRFGDGSAAWRGGWFGLRSAGQFRFCEKWRFLDGDRGCGGFGGRSGMGWGSGPGWAGGGGAGSGFGGHGITPRGNAGVAFGDARGDRGGSGFEARERGLIFGNAGAAAAMGAEAGADLVLPDQLGSWSGRRGGGQIGRRSAQNIILFGRTRRRNYAGGVASQLVKRLHEANPES